MQPVSDDFLGALAGSTSWRIWVDSWYEGSIVSADLGLTGSSKITYDSSRVLLSAMEGSAASADDDLWPTWWGSPLTPYGSLVQVRAALRDALNEVVSLGWFRVDSADPVSKVIRYKNGAVVRAGSRVSFRASDMMSKLDEHPFLIPEQVVTNSSAKSELIRIARDYVPIADLSAVADVSVPASFSYERSRVDAVQALAALLGDRKARINRNGALDLVPRSKTVTSSTTPNWTVEVGGSVSYETRAKVLDRGQTMTREGLYNGVITTGNLPDGTQVQGIAVETTGPLRWGGPHGRVPYHHNNPLITSSEAAQADAATRLRNLIRDRVVVLRLRVPANPALETDDVVRVVLDEGDYRGLVTAIDMPLPLSTMDISVAVPRDQFWG